MECQEARRLIDAEASHRIPAGQRTRLGEHLATCSGCRAYRGGADAQLLGSLLADQPELQAQATSRMPIVRRRRRASRKRWPLPLVVALGGLGLYIGYLLGSAGLALFTIRGNVQAMQITALPRAVVTSGPSPTPALRVPTAEPTAAVGGPPPLATGALTILLLGVDRRPGEDDPARTDAIAIARLEPATGRVALLSLPRDLIVTIPGYGQSRINAASVYGELSPELGGGIALTQRTVESLLGLPIDYAFEINFSGFTGAIDAIGGVDLNVEQEIYDPTYPTMDYGYQEVYFAPGYQHFDGTTTLIYSRVRHSDSDFGRMRRQQAVLRAAISRVRGRNPLEQIQLIADVSTALREDIRTDLSESLMASLAWTFRNTDPTSVEVYTLDETMISVGAAGDPYAQFALPGVLPQLVSQLMGDK